MFDIKNWLYQDLISLVSFISRFDYYLELKFILSSFILYLCIYIGL